MWNIRFAVDCGLYVKPTAALNEDYQPCPSTVGPFDLSSDPPRACIQVAINNDIIPENDEYFTATLGSPTDPLLRVDPDEAVTNVTIFDNDGETSYEYSVPSLILFSTSLSCTLIPFLSPSTCSNSADP